jgi:uncharacterized protein involved in response to NO
MTSPVVIDDPRTPTGCEDGCGHVPPAPTGAPLWRREPYRVLFPLGVALAWVGVGKWFLLAAAGVGTFASAGHAITQVQGFLMCFAAGFLLTAIPRRTGSAPASAGLVAIAALAPTITTIAANLGAFAASQTAWLVLVVALIGFAVRRLRGGGGARRRPPNAFVWIPVSFLLGLVGSILMALRARGPEWMSLHDLGKDLLVQGLFLGLILGVGALVFPLITREEGPPDGSASAADVRARGLHLLAALGLVSTFVVERWLSAPAGLALRAGVVVAVFLAAARLATPPQVPGLHRWVVWLGAWCVPAGLALAAALPPGMRFAALHLTFIGGFAALALAVGIHVSLSHADDEATLARRPWQVALLALLLAAAVGLRLAMVLDPARLWLWLGASAAAFLLATLAWAAFVGPRLFRSEAA